MHMKSNVDLPLQPKPQFKIIGHRGAASIAPENSLIGFSEAKRLGLNWVEFDTQICASGEWVVIHDETVDRTSNGQGYIAELSYQALKLLDAGSWFDSKYKNEPIPLLQQVLNTLAHLNLHPNIEIKGHFPDPHRACRSFLQLLNQHWSNTAFPPLVSSFNLEFLTTLKRMAPELPIGLIIDHWDNEALQIIKQNEFFSLHCDYKSIDFSYISKINPRSNSSSSLNSTLPPILAYTVNEPETAHQLFAQGIAAIFTDNPQLLT